MKKDATDKQQYFVIGLESHSGSQPLWPTHTESQEALRTISADWLERAKLRNKSVSSSVTPYFFCAEQILELKTTDS